MMKQLTIGLTGGIASGKSMVSDLLSELGAAVVDTDVVARDVVAPGSAGLDAVAARFGTRFVLADGSLDRGALRDLVFRKPAERKALEAITHPLIRQRCLELAHTTEGSYLVFVVPLLVGSSFVSLVDRVLLIDCSVETQLRRLMQRDGEQFDGAQRILAAQPERRARLTIADDVLLNDGSKAELTQRTAHWHAFYLSLVGDAS